MSDIARALAKQAKLDAEATSGPWRDRAWDFIDSSFKHRIYGRDNRRVTDDNLSATDAALIAHLRNQAALARQVIQAAVAGLNEVYYSIENNGWSDNAGKTLSGVEQALKAWADHVNGETP